MASSVADNLWNAVFTAVTKLGLALTVDDVTVTVIQGKVPKAEEGLEVLPVIYVSPGPPGSQRHWDTGTQGLGKTWRKRNEYNVECVGIASSDHDNTTGMGDYFSWREQIAQSTLVVPSTAGDPSVYDVEVVPGTVLDRPAWMANYDVTAISFRFICIENAF